MVKTLNDYFAMNYRMEIVEDKDEGGFVVSFPELPGCITCGETVESAVANALDAKKAWLEAAMEDGIEIHEPDSLEDYSGQFKLRIPRSLHRSLAEHSKKGRYQHESVLCISSFQKRCSLFKIAVAHSICNRYFEMPTLWQQKISKPK